MLSKIDKMEYFFNFTITWTVITVNPDQPVNTETITTDPIRVDENDQRAMSVFCDEVVNQNIPPGMALVNQADPQLFHRRDGFHPRGNDLNLVSVGWFIRNIIPTYLHQEPSFRTHYAFIISVVIREELSQL